MWSTIVRVLSESTVIKMKKKKKTNENKHKQTTKKQNKKGLFTY